MTLPSASVVICAYTELRWNDILLAVASVAEQTVPAQEIVLVIDHNPGLAARAREELSGVSILENHHKRGLSGARNTALEVVRGEVVAFLDDDAAARPDWLERLLTPYVDPKVVAVGGAAHPVWPYGRRPLLLPARQRAVGDATGELDWVVGCTYTGQPTTAAEVRNLMGCNMSFRRMVFERVGTFAEDVGRVGTVPLGCEETELCIRARQALRDVRIVFEPAASVDHRVSPDRVRWSYLRRRCWAEGLSKAAVSRMVGADDALSTERAYTSRVLPIALLRELGRMLGGDRGGLTGAIAVIIAVAYAGAGYLRGSLAKPPVTAGTLRSGSAHRIGAETGMGSAVYVAQVDLRHASTRLPVPTRPDITYQHAQVLVRWGARTRGVVRAALIDGEVDMTAVRALGFGTDADHEIALPTTPPSVSVVVPTADRPDAVSRCVKSLLATNYPELEVLIVDNRPASSSAGTLRALAASDGRVRYLPEPRKGVSSARNTGAAAADGELVAFLDDDMDVDQWWLHALVAELTDPTVDAATSLVLPSRLDSPAQVIFEGLKGFGQGALRRRFGPEVAATDPLYPFAPGRFGPGGAALWRRSSFVRLGGFRRLLGPGTPAKAGEDLEMFLRLARAGGSIVYTPDAVAWHEHRADWPGLGEQIYGYGVGLTAMYSAYFARRPWELVALARRAPAVLRHARALRSPQPKAVPAALTERLLQVERRGLVAGPFAYLRSVAIAASRASNVSRSGQ